MKKAIRSLIIDDENKSREVLKWMLQEYCPEVEILGLAESAEVAFEQIQRLHPNLLFLDVEMPYGTGFDLLKRLPQIDFEVIFVTGFDHYALKAIKYHALDYLLKPVDIDELIEAVKKVQWQIDKRMDTERLEKLLSNLQNQDAGQRQIAITQQDGREFIPVANITRCQADGACTWFYLVDGRRLLSSKNLGEYEKILPSPQGNYQNCFFRSHYGHLINLSQIKRLNRREKYVELKNGQRVPIAQRRAPRFSEILKQMNLL
ncbi:MAG: LytTR family DNA-binding domain-containing protein [Bacteroidota bacterium]